MGYYSSTPSYTGNTTLSNYYSPSSIYSRPKKKISCCGRWQGGSRCGSCPNN